MHRFVINSLFIMTHLGFFVHIQGLYFDQKSLIEYKKLIGQSTALAFNTPRSHIVVGDNMGFIKSYDLQEKKWGSYIKNGYLGIYDLVLQDRHLYVAGYGEGIGIWDFSTQQKTHQINILNSRNLFCKENILLIANSINWILVDTRTNSITANEKHYPTTRVNMRENEIVYGQHALLKFYDIRNKKTFTYSSESYAPITAFSCKKNEVVIGRSDGTMGIVQIQGENSFQYIPLPSFANKVMSIDSNDELVASTSEAGLFRITDIASVDPSTHTKSLWYGESNCYNADQIRFLNKDSFIVKIKDNYFAVCEKRKKENINNLYTTFRN